jgi:uncharacterized protein (DUF885 family)
MAASRSPGSAPGRTRRSHPGTWQMRSGAIRSTLSRQTGSSVDDLLAGLSQKLPDLIDQLTPNGRQSIADGVRRFRNRQVQAYRAVARSRCRSRPAAERTLVASVRMTQSELRRVEATYLQFRRHVVTMLSSGLFWGIPCASGTLRCGIGEVAGPLLKTDASSAEAMADQEL